MSDEHDKAFERWLRVLREAQLANVDRHGIAPGRLDGPAEIAQRYPYATLPREQLLLLNVNYRLMSNALAELLGLNPETMTVSDIASAMHRRAWEKTERAKNRRDAQLEDLMRRANEAFEALTPEEVAAHRREQAISWVYGEMRMGLNDDNASGVSPLTREQIAEIYDTHQAKKRTE